MKFAILLTIVLSTAARHAQSLKKVLILDVVNIDKNANYDYLVGSMTAAVAGDLYRRPNLGFRNS